jgi:NAD(P)-dependent dehydrogenase (short-subunit alcohol dehydrogenase family)
MPKLEGKVAVVTGGSAGIGLETARLFAEEGAFVYITGRRKPELEKAIAFVGHSIAAVQCDVSNPVELEEFYSRVSMEKGNIDVLVANAGVLEVRNLPDISRDHFDRTFGVNVWGTFLTVQKAPPLLNRGAAVILVSSIGAFKGVPAHGIYAATKAAIRSFGRTWTAELKERKIRVNTLTPGPVETPMFETYENADRMREYFTAAIPLGRMGRPIELAKAALFLASDESSFVAGAELVVDGGMTAV